MKAEQVNGGTNTYAETIIDYRTGKTEIKGVPSDTPFNRVKAAWFDHFRYVGLGLGVVLLGLVYVVKKIWAVNIPQSVLVWIIFGSVTALSLLSINPRWDKWFKKRYAVKTGEKVRNKVRLSEFKDKEIVLYDIKNIVMQYEADGDVAEKLNKIWIKQEHRSNLLGKQAKVSDILYVDNHPIWNAHFIFDDVPKDGYLELEWI